MKTVLTARIVLTAIGVVVWGYGQRRELPGMQMAGMGILVTVLLLRFIPKRWFDNE